MTSASLPVNGIASSKAAFWAGRILSGIVIAFLVMDGAMKLPPIRPVTDTMAALGWPADVTTARGLGVLILAIAALYAWPRTAVLGVVLLTGYLGGAIATHVRVGSPLFTHTFFGIYVGLLAWAGLWLRDARLRALLPFAGH